MKKPHLKIARTPVDKTLEFISRILLLLLWGVMVYVWVKSPATVPIHFAASGKPDRWGNKATLLILPGIATALFAGLTFIAAHPHRMNYPVRIDTKNAATQYANGIRLMQVVKLCVLAVFTFCMLLACSATIGTTEGAGKWLLPFTLIATLLPAGIGYSWFMKQSFK